MGICIEIPSGLLMAACSTLAFFYSPILCAAHHSHGQSEKARLPDLGKERRMVSAGFGAAKWLNGSTTGCVRAKVTATWVEGAAWSRQKTVNWLPDGPQSSLKQQGMSEDNEAGPRLEKQPLLVRPTSAKERYFVVAI